MYSKELIKGTLRPLVLKLLQEKGRMYGYEIAQEVKNRSDGNMLIKEGSLYPCLHALAEAGLVETETERVRGRIRKYYRLSEQGNAALPAFIAEIESFIASLQSLLHLKPGTHAI
ncbi:MAG: PadR family transcriptional regulator [Bacteroidota bacterium]